MAASAVVEPVDALAGAAAEGDNEGVKLDPKHRRDIRGAIKMGQGVFPDPREARIGIFLEALLHHSPTNIPTVQNLPLVVRTRRPGSPELLVVDDADQPGSIGEMVEQLFRLSRESG